MNARPSRQAAPRVPRPPLTLEHADRWTWRPWVDPARCDHPYRAFYHGTPERLTKRCGGCGAVLTSDLPRCPATNKKTSRQCRLPARVELGYRTCAAHQPDRGTAR